MTSSEAILRWSVVLLSLRYVSGLAFRGVLGGKREALGLPLILLLSSYLYWLLGVFVGLPSGALAVGRVPELVSFALGWLILRAAGGFAPASEHQSKGWDWVGDAVLAVAFAAALGIRSFTPEIVGAEKLPDLGIFQAVYWDRHFPPVDRWLAGVPLNYYYFSQLLFVPLSRVSGVPVEFAFNLATCTVAALTAGVAYAFVTGLTRHRLAGVAAASASILLSNWEWIRQLFTKDQFFWWDSSRAIGSGDTITEFPFFSFLLGDFHPHFTSLPWLGATLALVWILKSSMEEADVRKWIPIGVLTGLLVGAHYPMNPWELPFLALIATIFWNSKPTRKSVGITLAVGAASFLLFAPFWFQYERPVSGIYWVPRSLRSPLHEFFLHWGIFFTPVLLVLSLSFERLQKKRVWIAAAAAIGIGAGLGWAAGFTVGLAGFLWAEDKLRLDRMEDVVIAVALGTIFCCEFVSLDRTYGDTLLRLNTVFKFYTMAWGALALAVPVLVWRERECLARARRASAILLAGFVGLSLCYPFRGTYSRIGGVFPPPTLDGMKFWERDLPEERPAVDWLRKTAAEDVIWEADGPSYSLYTRMASFSGRASVLGTVNHEQVWRRNGYALAHEREEEMKVLKTHPTLGKLTEFLSKYRVRWVVVGSLEKKDYPQSLLDLLSTFPEVFSTPTTKIYASPFSIASSNRPASSTE